MNDNDQAVASLLLLAARELLTDQAAADRARARLAELIDRFTLHQPVSMIEVRALRGVPTSLRVPR